MIAATTTLISKERIKPMVGIISLFAFITLVFFAPVLFTNKYHLPNGSDFVNFNYPNDVFAARSLQAGEIPLWNPFVSGGQPYAADPNIGFFYPFRLLLTLTRFDYQRMVYLLIGHYFLAGLFTYGLARDLGASRAGSIVAGIGFMFSGFLIGQMDHINIIMSSIWLPITFLLFRRAILREEKKYAFMAGLTLSLSVLGGHQQFSLFTGYWCGFWLLIHMIQERGRSLISKAKSFGIMLIVAFGAAAIQIIPTVEFFQFTQRSALDIAQASAFSMPPIAWLLLLFPHYFGHTHRQGGLFWNTFPNEFYVYVGVIILFGAILGSYTWKSREKPFLISIVLLSFFLAVGDITPIYRILYYLLPGMKFVRVPGRFVLWVNLGLVLLAAFGVDWILHQMGKAERRLSRDTIFLSVLGVLTGISFYLIYPMLRPFQYPPEIEQYRLADSLVLSALFVGLTVLLCLQRYRPGIYPWRHVFLISLVILDLFIAQWPRHFTSQNTLQTFEHPEIVQYLNDNHDLQRISFTNEAFETEKWGPLSGLLYGFYQHRGLPWNPFNLYSFDNFNEAAGYEGPFYNFLGVKYLVAAQDENIPEQWQQQLSSGELSVFENIQVMPRAFMVYQSNVEPDRQIILTMIEKNQFEPLTVVLLENGEPFLSQIGTSQVNITSMTSNTMTVDIMSDQPGYLVVSDIFYPGWIVLVDGKEQEIQRANYAFRAIFVPSGQSTVHFEFKPASIIWGLSITLLTWFIIIISGIFYIKKKVPSFSCT